jgi:uncharacterized cupin superfamily protein
MSKKLDVNAASTVMGARYPPPYDEPCAGRFRRCLLEVGARRTTDDQVFYPDIDVQALKGRAGYAHKNGEPYVGQKPRNSVTVK